MRLLISDSNILIDMESGDLLDTLFKLPIQFAIPDMLYYEEIEQDSPGLERLGLKVLEVHGEFVAYALSLPAKYNHLIPAKNGSNPSHNDYIALALAKQEGCALATGDMNLRVVAVKEEVEVMGTIGILCAFVEYRLLSVNAALQALERMKAAKRRLPWSEAEKHLNELR